MNGDNEGVTTSHHASARRAERRRRIERRRRRAIVTVTSTLSACTMIVAGAFVVAGASGSDSGPQALGSGGIETRPVTETPSPTPTPTATATPDAEDTQQRPFCSQDVKDAIQSDDAEAVVRAAGGGDEFREGVLSGRADRCIALNHPAWDWVVVNKQRPIEPADYEPELTTPQTYSPIGAQLTPAAADALDALTTAASEAGVGDIGLESGYRSYAAQVEAYESQVASRGSTEAADLTSARPGYSEHQLGLAIDLVACDGTACGSMYDFGETPQGEWVSENAWRHGWIVRYEAHATDTTGYEAEPWHLRYVGVEIATAYKNGGYDTYEDFWGLDAAADYAD